LQEEEEEEEEEAKPNLRNIVTDWNLNSMSGLFGLVRWIKTTMIG